MFTAVVIRRPVIETELVEVVPPDTFAMLGLRNSRFAWMLPPNLNLPIKIPSRTVFGDALVKIGGVLPTERFDVHTHEYTLRGVLPIERIDGNIFRCTVDCMEFK